MDNGNRITSSDISEKPVNDIVDIVGGQCLTIGLTKDGEVYASGFDKQGQLIANQWKNIKVID